MGPELYESEDAWPCATLRFGVPHGIVVPEGRLTANGMSLFQQG